MLTVARNLVTHVDTVGMGKVFESVCLFVCPEHNSKMKDPRVFKLGTENNLEKS